jgi:hypothetical protein
LDGREALTVYRGVTLRAAHFERIQALLDDHLCRTRPELARLLCRRYGWRYSTGRYAVDAVRLALVRWARRGWLRLPASWQVGCGPAHTRRAREPAACAVEPSEVTVGGVLEVRPIRSEERTMWRQTMERHHYLGEGALVGETMRYVAAAGGVPVALLGWGSAARWNEPRDAWIGWDAAAKQGRLRLVVNNVRFLVLPWARGHNLATRVLGANLRRLSRDWEAAYGHRVLLAETFVDPSRFRGTCYRASNWVGLGRTRGFARHGLRYTQHGQPKEVFVYELHRRAREWLCAAHSPVDGGREGSMTKLNVEALPLEGRGGLLDVLDELPDVRKLRGRRHSLRYVLAVAVCATLAGAQSVLAIADWCADQARETLKRLGSRYGKPVSYTTLRRILGQIDADELDRRVGRWLVQHGPSLAGLGLALDGKTLRGSADGDRPAVHLLSAVLHKEGIVMAQRRVSDKTNEIPMAPPLLAPLPIKGAIVTADALHTQVKTAKYIVDKKKADYVFIFKDNQPTRRDDIRDLHLEASPPGTPDHGQGPRPVGDPEDLDQR